MAKVKDIVIIGAGGFGREVAWLIEDINREKVKYNILGFIDDDIKKIGLMINNYKVLGNIDYLKEKNNIFFTCAIGNAELKKKLVEIAKSYNAISETLIHPSVILGNYNKIGAGVIICAGNILTTNLKIDDYVTLNLGCTVGHDTIIGKYCTVYPSVNISGNCKIGELSELGTKTAIIQGISLGAKIISGAGTIIVKDIDGNCTVVGIPAKCIR